MSVVVSDTSPIRALHHLGLLDLLPRLFGEVLVPPAVAAELERPRPNRVVIRVADLAMVAVRTPRRPAPAAVVAADLGPGEIGAALLIDEARGRAFARSLGIEITGVLGVLARAKERDMVPRVRPLIDRLRREIDFFLSDALVEQVLRDIGETP